MKPKNHILELITSAIEEFDSPEMSLSALVRKAIRIAKLRDDFDNLMWLELEMVAKDDMESRKRLAIEYLSHYSLEAYKDNRVKIKSEFVAERSFKTIDEADNVKDIVCGLSISEIEESLGEIRSIFLSGAIDPTYVNASLLQTQLRGVLERVKQRVYRFLIDTEHQMRNGKYGSDIFERNKKYVHAQLEIIAPQALEQLGSIYQRAEENTPESRSQALISCRRILKTLADTLYPAKDNFVADDNGEKRDLSDDKYINRLWMYITEKISKSKSKEMLFAQATDLGNRLDKAYNLSNKGVHADISEFEMSQCIMQTYLLIGDILRIRENKSAIGQEGNIE